MCIFGTVRLQDGAFSNRGRVEVCNNDAWGTVCDNSWTSIDARTVCIQLGLPSSGRYACIVCLCVIFKISNALGSLSNQ